MRPNSRLQYVPLYAVLFLATLVCAQETAVPLIVQQVDDARLTRLEGNTHPLARPQFDRGAAAPNLLLERMLLVLKRSPERESALRQLLDDQQDKSSPSYHQWLTPDEFGRQFGPSDQDIKVVTTWLQSHGFRVARVANGRSMIEFSGTAAQVQEAFHTPIHKYAVDGEEHWANADNPQIPAAFAPVVAGVHTLHNFLKKPLIKLSAEAIPAMFQPGPPPQVTFSDGTHALSPADYAVIYNIKTAHLAGIDGTGLTIAVVGRSNINGQDVADFRGIFGLPYSYPQQIGDGPAPGDLGGGEEAEAILDASWSGAVAPNAAVDLVVSASTNTTDGVDLSELYIIDNNLAPVMTESFGQCEAAFGSAELQGFSDLAEQAAAQGITYLVSSGDSGAAGCDFPSSSSAHFSAGVNALSSSPFTVAVGGTRFNENGHNATYWNSRNNSDGSSVRSYIPENVWNESGPSLGLWSTGGGRSSFFHKPSWQSGVAGIPADGFRDVPDVSLTAALHDPYLICIGGSCQPDSQGRFFVYFAAGTSASAPSFAGIMALVNQKTGSRQGQAGFVLYRLAAAETLSQCNGSKTSGLPASNCIFNDVTVGNNSVPGLAGFNAGTGYDLATGLGSVNVNNLLNNWNTISFNPTMTTLSLTPTTITHGAAVNVTISVAPNGGSGTPSGDVALLTDTPSTSAVAFFTLSGGAVSQTSNVLSGGTYGVTAHYAGDATFAASDSAPVPVTVSSEPSITTLNVFGFDANGHLIPYASQPYGTPAYLRADVSRNSGQGTASGGVIFTNNGGNLTGDTYNLNSAGNTATALGVFTIQAGQHTIGASYLGDASFKPSNSPGLSIMVTKAANTAAVTSSSGTVGEGQVVTLTATLSTNSYGNGPMGTVTFLAGGTPLANGNPVTVSGTNGSGSIQTGILHAARGTASLVTADLPLGQDSITAQYSGDANYLPSTSPPITVNVQADFDMSASVPTLTIASPGGLGMLTLSITGHPGYSSTLNFTSASCSGLPALSRCSFSPTSVTGNGTTALTVTTTAPRSAMLLAPGWGPTALGGVFAGIFLLSAPAKRRRWHALLCLFVLAVLLLSAGCGGGSSNGGGGSPGTPRGSYTVIVTGNSGAFVRTASFMLNVQ